MGYTTAKDTEKWQVQRGIWITYRRGHYSMYWGKVFLLLTKGRIYLPLIRGDKARMLMLEKHREGRKKAASNFTLISSAHLTIIHLLFSWAAHPEYPRGETNYQVSQIFLQNSTHISVKQDINVLSLLSFKPDTAHVTDFEGDKPGHQVLSLHSVTQAVCRHNSGPAVTLPCHGWSSGQASST